MEKESTHKELIKGIREHLQFLATVQILFSAIVYNFYVAMGTDEVLSQKNAQTWLLGAGFCVLSYVFIGLGRELNRKFLVLTKWSIMLGLFFLALGIVTIITVQYGNLPAYFKLIFEISVWGSLLMPVITFLFISASLFWVLGQSFLKILRFKRRKVRDD